MQFIGYKDLLDSDETLSFENSAKAYQMILDAHPEKDVEFKRLLSDVVERAIAYAQYRLKWSLLSVQEKAAIDEERSMHHNIFINSINKLSVYMYQNKYGNDWEDVIGSDRKKMGDFACYLAYVYSINAR